MSTQELQHIQRMQHLGFKIIVVCLLVTITICTLYTTIVLYNAVTGMQHMVTRIESLDPTIAGLFS